MNGNKIGLVSKLNPLDDAPEVTEEWFETADFHRGNVLIRRGRPLGSGTRELVSLRIDRDALAAFRSTGPGWQSRINETLIESAKHFPKT